jgi:cytoskeletal protein CcmA (bactofilin family)
MTLSRASTQAELGVWTLIFTKKSDLAAGARSSRREGKPAALSVSVIGPDLIVTGNLETNGVLQVEGDVQGDIYAARIVVGEQARVVGDLLADDVVVGGMVQGSIRANSVTFRTGSHVEAEIYHRKLTIEQGAYFEGKSRRSEDPTGQNSGQR